ncbi:hypothetical protein BV95_04254 [Sphingobium chlorophenolicum]|uniref:Uncharacterized protein n=1 Tax=Sphingobium chlorophenolicum TaxID=46429 RepID=A0A081R8G0_SPHCR|nr:hypothetical protein BV95_04254 [Sphingobium chlorophenolicum]
MVDRLHREVERHELDDRLQSAHRRARADAGKAIFGDRRVDHPFGPELLQQALRHLVGALIFGDLLAHHEDPLVAAHLLCHGVAQRFAHGGLEIVGAFGQRGILDACLRLGREVGRAALGLARGGSRFRRSGRRAFLHLGSLGRIVALSRLALHRGDDGADLHALGALGHHDLADLAFVDRFEFHRRLVGLDLGQYVAGADLIPGLHQPFGQRAFLHRRRQRRHLDLDTHQYCSTSTSV